jgi:hypothetical protein
MAGVCGVQLAGADTAFARTKPRAAEPNALQAKCLQQIGAGRDPVTGKWMFYVGETDAMARIDSFKMCLAGGDRKKANAIGVPEIWMTHPGDRGPTSRAKKK